MILNYNYFFRQIIYIPEHIEKTDSMKTIYLYLFTAFLFMMHPYFNASGEESSDRSLAFTVITIPGEDVPDYLSKDSTVKIKNPLKNQGFSIDDSRKGLNKNINFDNCIMRDCVRDLKDSFPEKAVIMISITASEVKTGQKQISRYLAEDITEMRYTIYVLTADPSKEKYGLTFKRTFLDPTRLLNEAAQIGIKISEHYSPKKHADNTSMKNIKDENIAFSSESLSR